MPSTLALIRNMFHDEAQRRTAIAIWTGGTMSGIALGPVLSGFLLDHILVGLGLPDQRPVHADAAGARPGAGPRVPRPQPAVSTCSARCSRSGAVLPVIYGVKEIAANGVDASRSAYTAGRGGRRRDCSCCASCRSDHPMIDLKLFRSRGFTGSVLMNLVAMFAIVVFAIFTTQYPAVRARDEPDDRGRSCHSSPRSASGGVAPMTSALVQHFDRAYVAAGGFLIALCGSGCSPRSKRGPTSGSSWSGGGRVRQRAGSW